MHATEGTAYNLINPETDAEVQSHVTTCTHSQFLKSTDKQKEECHGWHHCSNSHTADIWLQAKIAIIGCMQREAYKPELTRACLKEGKAIPQNSLLRKLNPVLNPSGLLSIGDRLLHATLDKVEKNPLILLSRSHVATSLITTASRVLSTRAMSLLKGLSDQIVSRNLGPESALPVIYTSVPRAINSVEEQ